MMCCEYNEMTSSHDSDRRVASRVFLSVLPEDGASITAKRVGPEKF
jgi:hypothetical protein